MNDRERISASSDFTPRGPKIVTTSVRNLTEVIALSDRLIPGLRRSGERLSRGLDGLGRLASTRKLPV